MKLPPHSNLAPAAQADGPPTKSAAPESWWATNCARRRVFQNSSRTFLTDGRWEKIRAELKPGDFIIMPFGHNDSGPLDDVGDAGNPPANRQCGHLPRSPDST